MYYEDDRYYYDDPKDDLIHECKEYVRDIVQQLYSDKPINFEDLSWCLEEVCHLLSIKMPDTDLNVVRKKQSASEAFFSALDTCILYSKNKTKTLTK